MIILNNLKDFCLTNVQKKYEIYVKSKKIKRPGIFELRNFELGFSSQEFSSYEDCDVINQENMKSFPIINSILKIQKFIIELANSNFFSKKKFSSYETRKNKGFELRNSDFFFKKYVYELRISDFFQKIKVFE